MNFIKFNHKIIISLWVLAAIIEARPMGVEHMPTTGSSEHTSLREALEPFGGRLNSAKIDASKISENMLQNAHYPVNKDLQDRPPQNPSEFLLTPDNPAIIDLEKSELQWKSEKAHYLISGPGPNLFMPKMGSPLENPIKLGQYQGSPDPVTFELMNPRADPEKAGKYDLLRPLREVNNLVLAKRISKVDDRDVYEPLHDFGASERGHKFMGSPLSMDDATLLNLQRQKEWNSELREKFTDPTNFAKGNGKNGRIKSFEAEDMSSIRKMTLQNMQLSDYYKLDAETRHKVESQIGKETSIGELSRMRDNDQDRTSDKAHQVFNVLRGGLITPEYLIHEIKSDPAKYGLDKHFINENWESPKSWDKRNGIDTDVDGLNRIMEVVNRVHDNPEKYGLDEDEIKRLQGRKRIRSFLDDYFKLTKLREFKDYMKYMTYARDNHFDFNLNAVINNPYISHIKSKNPRQAIIFDLPTGKHAELVHDVFKNVYPDGKTTVAHNYDEVSQSHGAFIQMSLGTSQSDIPYPEFKKGEEMGQKEAMVVSASNDGSSVSPKTKMQNRRILVGATLADGITMSHYSNQPMKDPELQKRFMVAPGGFKNQQGTSFAAPMVSGALSKVLDYFPHISPMQGQDILLYAADPILIDKQGKPYDLKNVPAGEVEAYLKGKNIPLDDLKRGREKYGMGRLNVKRALEIALQSVDSPHPAITTSEHSATADPEHSTTADDEHSTIADDEHSTTADPEHIAPATPEHIAPDTPELSAPATPELSAPATPEFSAPADSELSAPAQLSTPEIPSQST